MPPGYFGPYPLPIAFTSRQFVWMESLQAEWQPVGLGIAREIPRDHFSQMLADDGRQLVRRRQSGDCRSNSANIRQQIFRNSLAGFLAEVDDKASPVGGIDNPLPYFQLGDGGVWVLAYPGTG